MLKLLTLSLAALTLGLAPAYANEGPLTSKLEAHVVTLDETGAEVLTQTEEVAPGETIEYTLTYENTSDRALSEIVINAPVPAASTLILDSATKQDGVAFQASADNGESWGTPPLMMTTDEGQVEVPVDEYDFLRWIPSSAIEAGEAWTFSYRVSVE